MSIQRIVVALGGNAILQRGQKGTAAEQMENVRVAARQIAEMIAAGYQVVVTHGNGPQVGALLIQNAAGAGQVPALPMDFCGAESQGFIGYMLCQCLRNELAARKIDGREPVCVVTQVLVDPNDPAFLNPTKPVGPFYSEEEAKKRSADGKEKWIEDAGRGWRRVVPSPKPAEIVERGAITSLLGSGATVVASGGGGVPVIRRENELSGVEAVIDKDLAGMLLACQVQADALVILTDVQAAAVNYGKPDEKWLGSVSVSDMKRYASEGHFKAGSMGPKVEAAVQFVQRGGQLSVITSLDKAVEALAGSAGTRISAGQ